MIVLSYKTLSFPRTPFAKYVSHNPIIIIIRLQWHYHSINFSSQTSPVKEIVAKNGEAHVWIHAPCTVMNADVRNIVFNMHLFCLPSHHVTLNEKEECTWNNVNLVVNFFKRQTPNFKWNHRIAQYIIIL
jgi:hypothetical protein